MKKAVIDIATNSVRLYAADVEHGRQQLIQKALKTTRLGEGIGRGNSIQQEPMARTVCAVGDFVQTARSLGAADKDIYIYATAMVREAENQEEFCRQVHAQCGIFSEVISGETEAEIAYLGAAAGYPEAGVLDIGGGSTEVVTKFSGRLSVLSQKIGAVRLKEKFSPYAQEGVVDTAPIKKYLSESFLPGYEDTGIRRATRLIGVSGTPTTLASLHLGYRTYHPQEIQGFVLQKTEMDRQLELLAEMTQPQRESYMGEFADRADIIVYGGCILSAFMEYYGFDALTVSDRDSLEGYLEYKLRILA